MNFTSIGDLATGLRFRQSNAQMKQHLERLSIEVTTGLAADTGKAVGGDYASLGGLDRALTTLDSYGLATNEAALLTDTIQTALETVASQVEGLGLSFQSAAAIGGATQIDTLATTAGQRLESAVSALNLRIADRYVLSGTAIDQRPLADASTLMTALGTAISGAATPADLVTAVQDFFDAPAGGGGYLDVMYQGSSTALAPIRIGDGESASVTLTAADPRLRDMLAALSLGALLTESPLDSASITDRQYIASTAGGLMAAAQSGVTEAQTEIGVVQERIANMQTSNSVEAAALGLARTRLVSVDSYDTASQLEAVQTQLETLYALTGHLSTMSLVDYL